MELMDQLERERDVIFLDINEICQEEIARKTKIGLELARCNTAHYRTLKLRILEKLLFSIPGKNRFVLQNFPDSQEEFEMVRQKLFPIDYLVTFLQPGNPIPFQDRNIMMMQFQSVNRLI